MSDKENIFSIATDWIIDVETDFVRLVTSLLPWAVPLVPAYIVFDHAQAQMNYDPWIAWVMGIVTEGLGLASLVTSFKFWAHNRKYQDSKNKYPIIVPVGTYIFYLAVVMLINVVLDWQSGVDIYKIIVVALFSLLSLPAGLLLSVQTIFAEGEKERREANRVAKQTREENKKREHELELAKQEKSKSSYHERQEPDNTLFDVVASFLEANGLTAFDIGRDGVMTPKELQEKINEPNLTSDYVRLILHRLRENK